MIRVGAYHRAGEEKFAGAEAIYTYTVAAKVRASPD